jgi:hypothetical protein
MVDLLVDEEIRNDEEGTGVCMEYLMRNGVLTILVNIAEADFPDGLRGEVIRTITNMINLLDDKFLVHGAVFKATLKLIRSSVEDPFASERYHEDLVDLMYVICSKIHGFPDLLHIFFHDRTWLRTPLKRAKHASLTPAGTPPSGRKDEGFAGAAITSTGISPAPSTTTAPVATTANASDLASPNATSEEGNRNSLNVITVNPRRSSLQPDVASGIVQRMDQPAPDYEFLLFTYLLRFLHREGKSGDYARTALLFIIELADGPLGEFVLHASSFPAVAAAAVGALYSQLPRTLISEEYGDFAGMDEEEMRMEMEDFRLQLDGFQKSLIFCQDVIDRCPTKHVGDSLLLHIKSVFLENILWPSLKGCIDVDGSAEAVISYLDIVLRSLREERFQDVVLDFLKMTPDAELTDNDMRVWEGDKRSEDEEIHPSQGFDLRRLVFEMLSSQHTGTVTAALNLVGTVLSRHCRRARRFVCGALVPHDSLKHSVFDHERELDLYMSVVASLDPRSTRDAPDFIAGYEKYLLDAELTLEGHKLYFHEHEPHYRYQIDSKSPLSRHLTRLLVRYFDSPRRLNLAVSGVLAALGACPCRDLDGWLACGDVSLDGMMGKVLDVNLSDTDSDEEGDGDSVDEDTVIEPSIGSVMSNLTIPHNEDDDVSTHTASTAVPRRKKSRKPPFGHISSKLPVIGPPPPLYRTLELLAGEVADLRSEFPEFEGLVQERRRGLLSLAIQPVPNKVGEERTLTELVDASIMLEEVVKEWVSLMQARRGLGFDLVRYE